MNEKAVFDLVPLVRAWREVGDANRDAELVGEPL
jgi:hypothetical protein